MTGARSLINVTEPQLIKEGDVISDIVSRARPKYYFIPFNRLKVNEIIISLVKFNSDAFLVARVLNNTHLPY
jgi:hypothetical protein